MARRPQIPEPDLGKIIEARLEQAGLLQGAGNNYPPGGGGGGGGGGSWPRPGIDENARNRILGELGLAVMYSRFAFGAYMSLLLVTIMFGFGYATDTEGLRTKLNPAVKQRIDDAVRTSRDLQRTVEVASVQLSQLTRVDTGELLEMSKELLREINTRVNFKEPIGEDTAANLTAVDKKSREVLDGHNPNISSDEARDYITRAQRIRSDMNTASAKNPRVDQLLEALKGANEVAERSLERVDTSTPLSETVVDVGFSVLFLALFTFLASSLRQTRHRLTRLWEKRVAVRHFDAIPWQQAGLTAQVVDISDGTAFDHGRTSLIDLLLARGNN